MAYALSLDKYFYHWICCLCSMQMQWFYGKSPLQFNRKILRPFRNEKHEGDSLSKTLFYCVCPIYRLSFGKSMRVIFHKLYIKDKTLARNLRNLFSVMRYKNWYNIYNMHLAMSYVIMIFTNVFYRSAKITKFHGVYLWIFFVLCTNRSRCNIFFYLIAKMMRKNSCYTFICWVGLAQIKKSHLFYPST